MSCKGCEKRRVGCHAECEDYIAEAAAHAAAREARRKAEQWEIHDYIVDIKRRIRRWRFRK